jgi:hypothetical protein
MPGRRPPASTRTIDACFWPRRASSSPRASSRTRSGCGGGMTAARPRRHPLERGNLRYTSR